jgi:hypothetical protein
VITKEKAVNPNPGARLCPANVIARRMSSVAAVVVNHLNALKVRSRPKQ